MSEEKPWCFGKPNRECFKCPFLKECFGVWQKFVVDRAIKRRMMKDE